MDVVLVGACGANLLPNYFRILCDMAIIPHDLTITKPDYDGGSIANLMCAVADSFGVTSSASSYVPLCGYEERLRDAERIVLLVVDGFGMELLRSIGRGTVFDKFFSRQMTSVYPPTTATAITTFMSGVAPQQHGLTGWFMHFRRLGAVAAVFPFIPRYGFESFTNAGVEIGSILDCPSFFDSLKCPSTALLPAVIADSEFSQLLGGRAHREAYSSLDDFASKLRNHCVGGEESKFVYAYWSEFDRLCHLHGPSSETVEQHLNALDEALTPIFEACANDGTVLVATADHGFIDSGTDRRIELDDHPEMLDMLSLPLCGEPRSAYCYVRPSCTVAFEQYVTSELSEYANLVPSDNLIADGWFGLGDAHPELAARVGDYTLQMKERYTIVDRVAGERRHQLEGVHGGTSAAEMFVPLMIAGP